MFYRFVKIDGSQLTVGDHTMDLDRFEHIYAIGAGKATYLHARR